VAGPFFDASQDLVDLQLTNLGGTNYQARVTKLVSGFTTPIDAEIIGNRIYVLEYSGNQGVWEITFPKTRTSVMITNPVVRAGALKFTITRAIAGLEYQVQASSNLLSWASLTNLVATSATENTAALTWNAVGDDSLTGIATSYDIRYSTTAITLANWATATAATGEPLPTAAGTQQTFTINALTPSRVYYIGIRTTDNSGNVSGLSNIPTATTPDTVPPAPVHDLSLDPDSGVMDPIVAASLKVEVALDAR